MYGEFDLTIPKTLQEAVKSLTAGGKRAVPLAGGTNVLVDVRSQRLAPERIVDLGRIGGLRGITVDGGRVTLGPRTTVSDLLASEEIAATAPALVESARVFAGQMVRNTATVAGNIACGSPAADLVPPLLALDAEVTLTGTTGSRTLAQTEVFQATSVSYRDMDASPLGFPRGETPFLGLPATLDLPLRVPGIPPATLSTGADIVSGAAYDGVDADMVDMETYAVLRACQAFDVGLLALRGISDGAAELRHVGDWTAYLHVVDEKLAAAVDMLAAALSEGSLAL